MRRGGGGGRGREQHFHICMRTIFLYFEKNCFSFPHLFFLFKGTLLEGGGGGGARPRQLCCLQSNYSSQNSSLEYLGGNKSKNTSMRIVHISIISHYSTLKYILLH